MSTTHSALSHWHSYSRADCLRLLDIDCSQSDRPDRAGDVNVHVRADDSAQDDIALYKAVLAISPGKVARSQRSCVGTS